MEITDSTNLDHLPWEPVDRILTNELEAVQIDDNGTVRDLLGLDVPYRKGDWLIARRPEPRKLKVIEVCSDSLFRDRYIWKST
ncbi:hypothetical protein LCGC14_1012450 [marine sediment metagenome]|uniref:Uncharacterized protein n=1 Tax=marine sediment metagenome TaxID=412755 RepID=A0A0F9N4C9_9ZZZZ